MKTKKQIQAEIDRNTSKIVDLQKQIGDLTAQNTEFQAALPDAPDEEIGKKYLSRYKRPNNQ